jgi:hypothetical protein
MKATSIILDLENESTIGILQVDLNPRGVAMTYRVGEGLLRNPENVRCRIVVLDRHISRVIELATHSRTNTFCQGI